MFNFFNKNFMRKIQGASREQVSHKNVETAIENYEKVLETIKTIFQDNDLIEFRELSVCGRNQIRICLAACDGLTDASMIDNFLIRPLMQMDIPKNEKLTADTLLSTVLQINGAKKTRDLNEVIKNITYGDTLLLVEGINECMLFSTKSFPARSISEPEGEKILSGPREGFTEVLMTNLAMVRRKFRTKKLKMRYYTLGKQTNTQLCIAYLDGIANPKIIRELYKRLDNIDIDGILDANYINELIRDDVWSPFRSTGYTERPDVVAAKLLEGRIAVFVDGTPVVLTLPYLFIENFQSNEDYYLSFYYTTFTRGLRILGFLLTILVPAVYIAIVAYHQEMLPAPLLINIAIERQGVPLPAALEAIIMLIVFEILRETALRMQTNVGQALSIVGALVVGQAAVEARLIAAPMLIIVALSGITSLLVPKMNASILLLRFGILLLASCLGFLGVTVGVAFALAHILGLRSFGIWQMSLGRKLQFQSVKDTVIRAPWRTMILRPWQLAKNVIRQNDRPEGQP